MRIDLPLCGFKNCKYQFDGNCTHEDEYETCEFTCMKTKDIPLLVDYIGDFYDNAKCKNCGNEFFKDEQDWKCTYCPECGQALNWTLEITRIIVARSRDFKYKEYLYEKVDKVIKDNRYTRIEIVSGGAKGADALGEQYAKDKGYTLSIFNADWNTYGREAGFIRNYTMAQYASQAKKSVLIAFPIGESKGTRDMIQRAKKEGFDVFVFET